MLQGFQSASAKIHHMPTEIDLEANGWVKLLSPTSDYYTITLTTTTQTSAMADRDGRPLP